MVRLLPAVGNWFEPFWFPTLDELRPALRLSF
jgi:hypothetical protein